MAIWVLWIEFWDIKGSDGQLTGSNLFVFYELQ